MNTPSIKTTRVSFLLFITLLPLFFFQHTALAAKKVVCLGDSITAGWPYITTDQNGSRVGGYEPSLESLGANSGHQMVVLNYGHPGEISSEGNERIQGVLDYENPDIVLVLEGTNDLYFISTDTVMYNLAGMVTKVLNKGASPVLATITPDTHFHKPISQMNDIIHLWAKNNKVKVADQYSALITNWSALNCGDQLHPNMAGYNVMAQTWLTAILSSLLSVSPASQKVAINAGSTTFNVSLIGSEPAIWTAQVISGAGWLSIATGATAFTCNFSANTGAATLARTATIRVTSTGATGSPTDVTVTQVGSSVRTFISSFPNAGIWSYGLGSASWTQITMSIPENLIYSGSQLYGDFGASGIWQWNGTVWSQVTAANPENLLAGGSTLYGDFGVYGVYSWNGISWTQLAAANPENLLVSGSNLYGDFGVNGTYLWNGTIWTQLTAANPENLLISGSNLYGDFGDSGIWKWNNAGTVWTKLGTLNPENLLIFGSTICGDFGATGIWQWTGTNMDWTELATANPENLYFSNSTLYGDFGTSGVWKWTGTGMAWTNLATANSENLLISNPVIYGDFGASGLWQWEDGSWFNLSLANPLKMLLSN
jgi:lysophospholipase L1-like esterase